MSDTVLMLKRNEYEVETTRHGGRGVIGSVIFKDGMLVVFGDEHEDTVFAAGEWSYIRPARRR